MQELDTYSPTNFRVVQWQKNKNGLALTVSVDVPTSSAVAILVFAIYADSVLFGQEVFPIHRIEITINPGQKDVKSDVIIESSDPLILECFVLDKNGRLLTDSSGDTVGFAESINFENK